MGNALPQANIMIQAGQGPLFKGVPLFNATSFRYQNVTSHNLQSTATIWIGTWKADCY